MRRFSESQRQFITQNAKTLLNHHRREFDESEHPRDEDGKFSDGPGGDDGDGGSGGGGGGGGASNWQDTASGNWTAAEKEIKDSGDEVTKITAGGKDQAANFINDLPYYDRQLSKSLSWSFITTPVGIAGLSINNLYKSNQIEIYQLFAVDRGAGRAAMQMMIDAADKHQVHLQLYAVPLRAQGEGKTLPKAKLEKFYAGFGFKQSGKRDSQGYILMKRQPTKASGKKMKTSKSQRTRIHLRGKLKAGLVKKDDAEDQSDFMDQCVSDMMDSGEASDLADAQDMCEMMWNEEIDD